MRLSRRDFHAVVVGGAIAGGVRLSGTQVGSEWRPLFDGTSLKAWRGLQVGRSARPAGGPRTGP